MFIVISLLLTALVVYLIDKQYKIDQEDPDWRL